MLFPDNMRSWVLESHAQSEVDAAVSINAKIEMELRGVEWILIRSPEKGSQVAPDVYLYVNRKATSRDALITVLYAYDDHEVTVLCIWIR